MYRYLIDKRKTSTLIIRFNSKIRMTNVNETLKRSTYKPHLKPKSFRLPYDIDSRPPVEVNERTNARFPEALGLETRSQAATGPQSWRERK